MKATAGGKCFSTKFSKRSDGLATVTVVEIKSDDKKSWSCIFCTVKSKTAGETEKSEERYNSFLRDAVTEVQKSMGW